MRKPQSIRYPKNEGQRRHVLAAFNFPHVGSLYACHVRQSLLGDPLRKAGSPDCVAKSLRNYRIMSR